MPPFRVFVTRAIPSRGIDILKEFASVEVNPLDRPLAREELYEKIRDCHGVMGLLTDSIDSAFFDHAAKLKGYANYAVGFDNIDVAEATRRGIPVSNTPGVLTEATAEMAWALLFAVCRKVAVSDRTVRSGKWKGWNPLEFLGEGVSGKTLGIVGPGRIGTAMALMSAGFSMRVVYCSPQEKNPILEKKLKARRVSFEKLLAESDFISIHTPLTPQTRHLFDEKAFASMKPTACLINTARGPVVDEAALVRALKNGVIAGAGLDVYEFEPLVTPGLTSLDNVVLAAHTGSATVKARTDMAILAAENLVAMLKDEKPPNCLNPQVLAK